MYFMLGYLGVIMKKLILCLSLSLLLVFPLVSMAEVKDQATSGDAAKATINKTKNPAYDSTEESKLKMQAAPLAADNVDKAKASQNKNETVKWDITGLLLNKTKSYLLANNENTIEAKTTYEKDGLKYKYVYSYNNWSDWGVLSPLNSKTVKWTPKKHGSYEIYVDVTDEAGKTITKVFKVTVSKGWSIKGLTAPSECNVGSSGNINLQAQSEIGSLKYKFVFSYNDWSEWGVLQDESSKATAVFTPKKAGKYDIYVDVIDKYGVVETKSVRIESKLPWTYSGISSPRRMEVNKIGNVAAGVSGDTSKLSYKFVYSYNNWSKWGVIQEGEKTSINFKPEIAGEYEIYVDVKDANGNVATKSVVIDVVPDWSFTGIALSSANVDPGDKITITPSVTGNKSGLKYKFVYSYLDWNKWGVIKGQSTAANAQFKIELPGYYDIYVDVTDESGYTVTKNIRVLSAGGKVPVLNQDWFGVVNSALPRLGVYTVIDVKTGKRFNIKRLYGTNHADVEPLTVKDTAILKDIYGGSWSWDRRPVIVLNNEKAYAGSMNGMPHGSSTIDNGMSGHICIHFLNSKTHGSNQIDPGHKAAVAAAAAVGSVKL